MIGRLRGFVHWHEALAILAGCILMLRQAWLLDDAFVYFRYADNLLFLGRGLVYNQGEWVEGYSSPLWMLLCIVLRALQMDWWWLVRIVGVLSWIGFGLLLCDAEREWRRPGGLQFNAPLLFLACCYPVLCYFTSGLESPLVQLAALSTAMAVLQPHRRRWQLAAGLLILVRHEFALAWLVLLAWIWWRRRSIPWALLASTACCVGGWLLARVWLYAELLPNTFYLKDAALPAQGWLYLRQLLSAQALPLWLLAFAAVAWLARHRDHEFGLRWPERAVLLLIAVLQGAYVVRVGGDMVYYRFLAFSFLLVWVAMGGIAAAFLQTLPRRRWPAIATGFLLAFLSLSAKPPQLDRNPHLGLANVDQDRPVLVDDINDAMSHRRHPDLSFSPWTARAVLDQRDTYREYRAGRATAGHDSTEWQGWCIQSWYDYRVRVVQRWGLTEPLLARIVMPWDRPGHKFGLVAHARRLAGMRRKAERDGDSVRLTDIAASGRPVPHWVTRNLDAIALIEDKMYNRHHFFENLSLSFHFVGDFREGKPASGPK